MGGKRLDAFLVPTVLWDTLCPSSYRVKTFPSTGDHAGVQIYTSVALPSIEPLDRSVPNIRHWCSRDFEKFRAHFLGWMRGLPTGMPIQEKSERILQEVKQYVTLQQKPHPCEDPVEQSILSPLCTAPQDQGALNQWGAHMQKKRHRAAFCQLRRFKKAEVTPSGPFFCELCNWVMRPFDRSTVSLSPQSALAKLPQFARNPTWDPVAASALLSNIFHNQPTIRCAPPPPTWQDFVQCIRNPKRQSAGMDHVPPHLLDHVPETAQWVLYQHVLEVWRSGTIPVSWTDTRISNLCSCV